MMVWIGIVGLLAALACTAMAYYARFRIRAMASTETLAVQELRALHQAARDAAGEGQFRYRCEVVGAARPHVSGALKSELGGVDCVWHKHRVTHRYWETRTDSKGNRRRVESSKVVSQHASNTAFFVEDATGTMVIQPGKQEVDGADKVLDRFERGGGGGAAGGQLRIGSLSLQLPTSQGSTIGYQNEEWVVPPGRRLYVHGEASDARGKLAIGAPEEGGVFIISTRSQEELMRSENFKFMGFGAGAVVAAVLGGVLLVLGVVG